MFRAYIGVGSNLGDRRANIFAALQRVRARAVVTAVSSFYESEPADGAQGPAFLNVAAEVEANADRQAFEQMLAEAQRYVGRQSERRLDARPIDIDLLVFKGWEHPQLRLRPYNIVPLAEIAPEYAGRISATGPMPQRLEHGLRFAADRQEEEPEVRIALNTVGVSRVRRVLPIEIDGRTSVANAEFSMVADLGPDRSGVHMSRFVEVLEETTLDVLAQMEEPARIERLAEAVARAIAASHETIAAEVRLHARFALERWTPVSGKRSQESYELLGIAHVRSGEARRLVGVEVEGMTACPCAQAMMRERGLRELHDAGFNDEDARRALDALPMATHNQRGLGRLLVGTQSDAALREVRIEDLVEIVEGAMSAETYDLLKRPDEFFIVNKAHRNPKFVEDVVRAAIARTLATYETFSDEAFVFASQRNDESIHKHDAFAQAFGCFGEFRKELSGNAVTSRTRTSEWLRGRRFASEARDEN
ncbi:MAG: GTP cyclohydrolase MptA [Candidatus Tyrphobacter sp.]